MAPVEAQIVLAKEIGENQSYQQYLITIRQVEANQAIGVEQARALDKADIKVIANSGTVTIRGTTAATKATASVLMTDGVASTSTTTGTLVVTGGVGISGRFSAASAVIEGTVNALITESTKTADYTLALVDRDTTVAFTGSSAQTVTVPTDAAVAFPTGSVVYIGRFGSGSLTLAASAGVSITKNWHFLS
jgi:hypothetical protein